MEPKKDIGALWVKKGRAGDYLSGYVTLEGIKYPIVCFLNSHKKEAKHPDYKILPSEPRPAQERTEDAQRAPITEVGQTPAEEAATDDDNPYPDVTF